MHGQRYKKEAWLLRNNRRKNMSEKMSYGNILIMNIN